VPDGEAMHERTEADSLDYAPHVNSPGLLRFDGLAPPPVSGLRNRPA
jgi:hypothetical protein